MPTFASRRGSRRDRLGPEDSRAPAVVLTVVCLTLLAVLATVLVVTARSISAGLAVDNAEKEGRRVADGLVAPLVSEAVRRGDPDAVRRLAVAMQHRIRDGSFDHIKIYDRSGRVLWSDEGELVGRTFDMEPEAAPLFGSLDVIAHYERPDATGPGHVGEQTEVTQLEVHVGARDDDGVPFVFEAYVPPEHVESDAGAVFRAILPLGLGGLILLQLALLPIGVFLIRRLAQERRRRSEILERALSSWHAERRRLAQDLHDGVIQNLAAAAYALPAVLDKLPADPSADDAREVGDRIAHMLERDITALRTLTLDQVPELTGHGFRAAIEGLTSRTSEFGVEGRLVMPSTLEVDPVVAGVAYRVVREGLRNIELHADARNAEVTLLRDGAELVVRLTDDGRGPGTGQPQDGHLGLHLLAGLMLDIGGTMQLTESESGGSVLEARFPAAVGQLSN